MPMTFLLCSIPSSADACTALPPGWVAYKLLHPLIRRCMSDICTVCGVKLGLLSGSKVWGLQLGCKARMQNPDKSPGVKFGFKVKVIVWVKRQG